MQNNQSRGNRGPGGQNPRTPKTEIRIRHELVPDFGNNTYDLTIQVRCFSSGQPMSGQEVCLSRGITEINSLTLADDGSVQFALCGTLKASEQRLDLIISLVGTAQEKMFSITVPAKAAAPKKDLQITVQPNLHSADVEAVFLVKVLADGKPSAGERVQLHEEAALRGTETSDNSGVCSFRVLVPRQSEERTVKFFVSLDNYREEALVVIPALEKKERKDAESLVVMPFRCSDGTFSVKARVLGEKARALASRNVSFWFRGENNKTTTDADGEVVFHTGVIEPGTEERLTASVDGIYQDAKSRLRNRRWRDRQPAFSPGWWLGENNGRAFIGLCLAALIWIICFLVGTGDPIINSTMFRKSGLEDFRKEMYQEKMNDPRLSKREKRKTERSMKKEEQATFLSAAERRYNAAVQPAGEKYLIAPASPVNEGPRKLWMFAFFFTLVAIAYFIFAARDEFAEAYEEAIESLFHQEYARAGDPAFERLAHMAGTYAVARKQAATDPTAVTSDDITAAQTATGQNDRHATLGQLFFLDMGSKILVDTVTRGCGRIFRRA